MENLLRPGEAVQLSPRVRRLTAPNPGMMTGPGTNSYIIGTDELTMIDPGPEIESHIAALLSVVGGNLRRILTTHTHFDHSPAARAVKAATGAEVLGMPAPPQSNQDGQFAPDRVPRHGEVIACGDFSLRAVHTPGHASNHLCYLLLEERLLFTGDHVMQGSTVVITPPDGDMGAYLRSLEELLTLDINCIAPGHGHLIDKPHDEARRLIAHRLKREQKVVEGLAAKHPATLDELVAVVYADTPLKLHGAAKRSLYAHLLKLEADGRAVCEREYWRLNPAITK
jgi:glyoxylase-like metal-dependent hydrolase (beta-lactamase superfamily II)